MNDDYADEWLDGATPEPRPALAEAIAREEARMEIEREFAAGYDATPDEAKAGQ